jgi:hypothetical protein
MTAVRVVPCTASGQRHLDRKHADRAVLVAQERYNTAVSTGAAQVFASAVATDEVHEAARLALVDLVGAYRRAARAWRGSQRHWGYYYAALHLSGVLERAGVAS